MKVFEVLDNALSECDYGDVYVVLPEIPANDSAKHTRIEKTPDCLSYYVEGLPDNAQFGYFTITKKISLDFARYRVVCTYDFKEGKWKIDIDEAKGNESNHVHLSESRIPESILYGLQEWQERWLPSGSRESGSIEIPTDLMEEEESEEDEDHNTEWAWKGLSKDEYYDQLADEYYANEEAEREMEAEEQRKLLNHNESTTSTSLDSPNQ